MLLQTLKNQLLAPMTLDTACFLAGTMIKAHAGDTVSGILNNSQFPPQEESP
jgi:hypothetical protein